MPRLEYPTQTIPETDLFGEPVATLPYDDRLRTDEWEPVEVEPDLHEECYERTLFDE